MNSNNRCMRLKHFGFFGRASIAAGTGSLSEYCAWPYLSRFPLSRGGADVVGSRPNEEATTTNEGKSARSLRVGWERGVCGVARLDRSARYGPRRAPCIRSLSQPTRLTRNTQTGSPACMLAVPAVSDHEMKSHSRHFGL